MKNRVSKHIVQVPNVFTLVQSHFSIILHASYPVEIYCLMEDPRCVSVSYDHPCACNRVASTLPINDALRHQSTVGVYTCLVTLAMTFASQDVMLLLMGFRNFT